MAASLIHLHSDTVSLDVCPAAGGVITRYCQEQDNRRIDWLWPASITAIGQRDPLGMSCFPLVPFSNRIRNGRFRFQGQEHQLPLNFLPAPHAIHGQGWQREWVVIDTDKQQLIIEYRHTPDSWPWRYCARQTFQLNPEQLTVTIAVHNESTQAMPVGIGLHPYFIRTPQVRVSAVADHIWLNDAEVMPLECVKPDPERDINQGILLDKVVLDNTYTGWPGQALIEWPEWQARLTINATAMLKFLVVYAPLQQAYFCVEPVSHTTDAFNLADQSDDDTGMVVLEPDESLSATVVFRPEFTA